MTTQLQKKARHWKEQMDPAASYVWRKCLTCGGKQVQAGDPVDVSLFTPLRLRKLWDAGWIQLAGFVPAKVHDPHSTTSGVAGAGAKRA